MARLSKDDAELLQADIEAVIVSGKWSTRAAIQLGRRYNTSSRTVYTHKQRIEQQWRDAARIQNIEEHLAGWLARMHQAQSLAVRMENPSALAKLLMAEARVIGMEAPAKLQLSGDVTVTPLLSADELEARLRRAQERKALADNVIGLYSHEVEER